MQVPWRLIPVCPQVWRKQEEAEGWANEQVVYLETWVLTWGLTATLEKAPLGDCKAGIVLQWLGLDIFETNNLLDLDQPPRFWLGFLTETRINQTDGVMA